MREMAGAYEGVFAEAALTLDTRIVAGIVRLGESASLPLVLRGDMCSIRVAPA